MTSTQIIEVVASGTLEKIEHWEELLRQARIECEVRTSFDDRNPATRNFAELWVNRNQADRARSIICRDPLADRSLLW